MTKKRHTLGTKLVKGKPSKKPPKKKIPVATTIDLTNVSPVDTCIAYKVVAATQEGQIVIADLMRRFGFSRNTTYVPGDPDMTVWREGQRTVIIHIGRMIDADPASFEDQEQVEM